MEVGGRNVQPGHLGVGDLDAFVVGVLVEPTLDGKAGLGRGAGDQLDDDQVANQWLAAPVLTQFPQFDRKSITLPVH